MELFTVSFFGHRYLGNPFQIEDKLEEIIRSLIEGHEYVDFLVGKNGEFDQLVSSTVRRTRRVYRDDNSSLVLVLPYATSEYLNNQQYYEEYYDDIDVSFSASGAHPKAAIQTRNREMVDRSDLVIFFVEHKSGGAYQTMQYAQKKGKTIINLAAEEEDSTEF